MFAPHAGHRSPLTLFARSLSALFLRFLNFCQPPPPLSSVHVLFFFSRNFESYIRFRSGEFLAGRWRHFVECSVQLSVLWPFSSSSFPNVLAPGKQCLYGSLCLTVLSFCCHLPTRSRTKLVVSCCPRESRTRAPVADLTRMTCFQVRPPGVAGPP